MPVKHARRRKMTWTRKGRPIRSRVQLGAALRRKYSFKCFPQQKLVLSDDQWRDIYLEVEEDALNEGGTRAKAKRLVSNPEWIKNEAHDIALKNNFNEEQRQALQDFLIGEFIPREAYKYQITYFDPSDEEGRREKTWRFKTLKEAQAQRDELSIVWDTPKREIPIVKIGTRRGKRKSR